MAGGTALELETQLDGATFGRLAMLVCALTSLAMVIDGFDIQAIAFAAPALLSEWQMTRADLAPVLAAGLLGMGVGAFGLGQLGDRYGRRPALIACMLLMAGASLMSALATSQFELGLWRAITGLGLGGAMPNATALMVEFAPRRVRNVVVAITVVGVPIGGLIGSAMAADVVPRYGWPAIFVVGAALPALLAVAMALWLPESPRFLATQPGRAAELLRLMRRVRPGEHFDEAVTWSAGSARVERAGLAALLTREFRRETLVIWLIFCTNVFCVYAFFNWTPTILTAAGLTFADALHGSLLFNLGGMIGAIVGALAMGRAGSRPVLITLGVTAVASTWAIGRASIASGVDLWPMFVLVAIAGAAVSGIQVQMFTVAAAVYPTRIRSTGVGWALAIARFGGVLSAFAGSAVQALGSGTRPFFTGIAGVLGLTLAGIVILRRHLPAAVPVPSLARVNIGKT